MYVTTDSLGHSEICDGDLPATGSLQKIANKWKQYWDREDVKNRLREGKELQLQNLSTKFFNAANEAILYKTPFKNPLTNTDMAYIYKATEGEGKWVFEWDRFYTGDTAIRLLRDIDLALANLRASGIPIV